MRGESNAKAMGLEAQLPLELWQKEGAVGDEMHGGHVLKVSLGLEQTEGVAHTAQAALQSQGGWGLLGSSFEVYDGTREGCAVFAGVEAAVGDLTYIAVFQPRA